MMSYYATSDLHGNYYLWNKIKNFLKKDDVLFYLGDACDRGKDGIQIMQELLKDKRVTYLLGNHELMFLNAIKTQTDDNWYDIQHNEMLWLYNGGKPTYEQWHQLSKDEQTALKIKIASLPIYATYKGENHNVVLCHSGLSSEQLLLEMNKNSSKDMDLYIWNREHIQEEKWCLSNSLKNIYIVHGHTPVCVLNQFNYTIKDNQDDKICKYCDGHKIDIDMGTYATNTACLLDLDTLEAVYFKEEKEDE